MENTWRNWAGDQSCEPVEAARPRNRDELAEAIGRAVAAGRKVSVAGSGHSFTEAALTEGTLIEIEALSGVIDADPSSGLVRVGGGTVLAELNEALSRLGLAMENLGDIDRQTIAGAISTGTHGTGAKLRNISSQVEAVELVLADGSVRELTAAGEPSLLRAARVGIGALGAISAVTLRCVPAFILRRVDTPRPIDEVLDTFQERADANDHYEFFTFPYADTALVLERNRTEKPPRPRGRTAAFLNDIVLENWALEALSATGKRFPGSIPRLSRLAARLASGSSFDRPQRSDLRQRAPRPFHRDGVRRAARARAGGGAAGDRVGARQSLPGLLPDRDAGRRRGRRPAQPLARARHRLHRRPPVPRDGVAPLLRGGRGDHERLRRPPPLGQAPLPDRRYPGAALSGLGGVPARPRRARPGARLHQRVRRPSAWALHSRAR